MSKLTEDHIESMEEMIDRAAEELRILREIKRKNMEVEEERHKLNQENGSERIGGPGA
jgi:hypothetical protein